ncbi:ABC transporter substrate-binding protein [Geobacter sp. SVR]|uniref:ABC transporter substrate-binding protein n=1 Tax=Geobacter sp. SVR TaxID=2495594 RepID=UPI00143F0539|nr:ABC transporter substrate-binding protein [Geobacter sp. SVR]BCS54652.1 ABC transporter substrate-binding protein [Geobacter sp. SVR]GCF86840.1 ABC transporter substrate-binding protein [Geobacter sp. SVR]
MLKVKSILVALILTAIVSCDKSPPPPPLKLTLAYTALPNGTLVHVAMANGYFVQEGLQVQALRHTYGKAALQSVLDGTADLATTAETPLVFEILKGSKLFIVANIFSATRNHAIIARRDHGISTPTDLKGHRIGYTPGSTSDFFMDSMLTANGIDRRDVVPIPLKPEEMFSALTTGMVDAACIWNFPLMQLHKALGEKGVGFFDNHIYTETLNIAGHQEFIRNNPEAVKRLLRALIKAERFVRDHPDQTRSIAAAYNGVDKTLLLEPWSTFTFRVTLDDTLLITMEDETRWAMKKGLTNRTRMPDYKSFIYQDALAEVNPDAVR